MFVFRRLTKEDMPLVLQWRSSGHVNRHMVTDFSGDLAGQLQWFDKIQNDATVAYWMICCRGDQPAGVINLDGIDYDNKTSHWGFYFGNTEFLNLGGLVPPYFYNHVFSNTPIETLVAEVDSENSTVLKLHALHGYVPSTEPARSFTKNNQERELRRLVLRKSTWQQKRRFKKMKAVFE